MYKLIFISFVALIGLTLGFSCTDLTEEVYSEFSSDQFYQNEEQVVSAMAPAYASLLNLINGRGILIHEEQTTDILCGVTRDYGGWYDGGHSQKFHEHTWTPETGYINNFWTHAYGWVNQANRLIYQFDQLDNMDPDLKASFQGELSILRAFGYYNLLNSFGNVPIVDRFDVEPGFIPANNANFEAGRKEVFDFIERDILDNISNLNPEVNSATYGRFNKWVALALGVKLYMNAEVWTGVPRWDDAIAFADEIINSGLFQLESDYFANFSVNNEGSTENIFSVPFDQALTGGNMSNWVYVMHHHFSSQPTVNAPRGANNGTAAIPSHVHSFHPDDLRLKGWNVGPQYVLGTTTIATNTRTNTPLYFTIDYDDPLANAVPGIVYDYRNAPEGGGARPRKYEVNYAAGTQAENDLPVYRLSDILLLKAEAILRKNGGAATQEAVDLVNQVRGRAFEDPSGHLVTLSTLTLEAILQERAWELYYEGHRRNDLIRFGKFAQGDWEWYDRSGHGDHKNYYPIPQVQINTNPNLVQSPGY